MIISGDDKALAPIRKIREKISDHLDALDQLDEAPPPIDDIERRLDTWLASDGGGGSSANIMPGLLSPDGRSFAHNEAWTYSSEHQFAFNLMDQMLRFHASLFPEQLKTALMTEARRRLEARKPGLPLAERPAERKRLAAELRNLEIDEEKAIEKVEATTGEIVPRRPDADPAVILGEVKA